MAAAATWTVRELDDPLLVSRLAESIGLGSIATACLVSRGITNKTDAGAFLEPALSDLEIPLEMADLDLAANRLADAVEKGEKIGVFGDYDVDGVSSAALLTSFLNTVGAQTQTVIADRFSGYGMGVQTIDFFSRRGCSVVATVDCGTSDHEAVRRAAEMGMDVIVIDHHRIEGAHPQVLAFVNPEREDCGFTDNSMAAVGLVFYFVAAIRTVLCDRRTIKRNDVDLRRLLDLVALGTVADVMPLRGNNRILVYHGLDQMTKAPRNGLKSLIRIARIRSRQMRSDHIAYQLAPRLNAAGRLSSAAEAYEILMVKEQASAELLAARLDELSNERRLLEKKVFDAATQAIFDRAMEKDPVLVVSGDGWHRGVLGIVASRLVERFGKPSFVVGFEGGLGTGSARSGGRINLHETLSQASGHLLRFGGHRNAAGFSVDRGSMEKLRTALVDYGSKAIVQEGDMKMVCEAKLHASQITPELVRDLGRLGPFGQGNSEPIFEIDGLYVLDARVVGQDHLKLELKTPSGSISAFGPRLGEYAGGIPNLICVAAAVTLDEWRGDGSPELRLVAPPVPGA